MKKLFIFFGILLLVCGCGKYDDSDLIKDLSKKVDDSKAYHLTGTLDDQMIFILSWGFSVCFFSNILFPFS